MEIFAQAVGIVAMLFFVFSYQQKSAKGIITLQMIGTALFAINFLLLGEFLGACLNLIACIRAILFLQKKKLHTDNIPWLIGFTVSYLAAYVLSFTVFGTEPTLSNLLLQCCPVLGMFFMHLGMRNEDTQKIRFLCLFSSISWLIFNSAVLAIGGMLGESFNLVSITVAFFRFKKAPQETK